MSGADIAAPLFFSKFTTRESKIGLLLIDTFRRGFNLMIMATWKRVPLNCLSTEMVNLAAVSEQNHLTVF